MRIPKLVVRSLITLGLLIFTSSLGTIQAQGDVLRVTATLKLEPTMVDGQPALEGNYHIMCSMQDGKTTYGFGNMTVLYSLTIGDGDVEVKGLSGLYANGGSTDVPAGSLEVTGPLGGSRVRAKLSGVYCHHDQLNSELITVWSDYVVIPPQIRVVAAFNPERPNDKPLVPLGQPTPITTVLNVPAGQKLAIYLDINAHPVRTESVILHYENAGVRLTSVLYDVVKDYNPLQQVVTPTVVNDNLKVWAEFWPTETMSNVLQFHVVAPPKASH